MFSFHYDETLVDGELFRRSTIRTQTITLAKTKEPNILTVQIALAKNNSKGHLFRFCLFRLGLNTPR